MTAGRQVVFLDRDGVLTVPEERGGKGYAVRTLEALNFYTDAASSVARLRAAGYDVVVVTNQPDGANGLIEAVALEEIHCKVMEVTGVTRIRTCPHSRADNCSCRKPRAGLLMDEAADEPVDFGSSWMIGDRDSDIDAGLAVGCRTVFLDRGWRAETGLRAESIASTLSDAVDTILAT